MYGRFTFTVNQAVAELVREQIAFRCQANRKLKVEKGGWVGHAVPFGYRAFQGELVPDPTEQFVLRYIWRLYKWTNASQREITNKLNQRMLAGDGDERFLPKSAKPSIRARKRPYVRERSFTWRQSTVQKIIKYLNLGIYQEQWKTQRPGTIRASRKRSKAS